MADTPGQGLADALKGVSGDALDSVKALTDLNKQMALLVKNQKDAAAGVSNKAFLNAVALQKATEKLIDLEEERSKLTKLRAMTYVKDKAAMDMLTKSIADNEKQIEKNRGTILKAQKDVNEAYDKTRKAVLEKNQAEIDAWKQGTVSGKVYSGLTGTLGKYTAGLTASALAMKALQRVKDAAILSQDIDLRNFRAINVAQAASIEKTEKSTAATVAAGLGLGKLYDDAEKTFHAMQSVASGATQVGAHIFKMSDAIVSARATAILLGKDTGEVTEVMKEFARIAGTRNPEALKTLTEGAMSVSKVLQITTAEAVDYVSQRMNKFGGSAAGAILELGDMRAEALKLNAEFGHTIIRGDDLARTLLDIGKDATVYALDQKYVSDVLLTSIARLQSMGDSYDQARAKAKGFTEQLAGKGAPEYMKAFVGQDLLSGMTKAIKTGMPTFEKEYGEALDRAQPGLKRKVQDIVTAVNIPWYEKTRLIQNLTSGTEVGAISMAKQINTLWESTGHSVLAVQKIMGLATEEQAYSEAMLAQAMVKREDLIKKLGSLSAKELAESQLAKKAGVDVSEEEAEVLLKTPGLIAMRIKLQERLNLVNDTKKMDADKRETARLQVEAIQKEIDAAENLKSITTDSDQKIALDNLIESRKSDLLIMEEAAKRGAETAKKEAEADAELLRLRKEHAAAPEGEKKASLGEQIKKLEAQKLEIKTTSEASAMDQAMYKVQEQSADYLEELQATNVASGRTLEAGFESLGNIHTLLSGATGLSALYLLSKATGMSTEKLLMGLITTTLAITPFTAIAGAAVLATYGATKLAESHFDKKGSEQNIEREKIAAAEENKLIKKRDRLQAEAAEYKERAEKASSPAKAKELEEKAQKKTAEAAAIGVASEKVVVDHRTKILEERTKKEEAAKATAEDFRFRLGWAPGEKARETREEKREKVEKEKEKEAPSVLGVTVTAVPSRVPTATPETMATTAATAATTAAAVKAVGTTIATNATVAAATQATATQAAAAAVKDTTPTPTTPPVGAVTSTPELGSYVPGMGMGPIAPAPETGRGTGESRTAGQQAQGAFVGGVQGDGSIMMKVSNFMDAYSSAKFMETKGVGRGRS